MNNEHYIKLIKIKLEENNICSDKFLELFNNFDIYLSGSFLLQILSNKKIDYSNLDLFVLDNVKKLILEDEIIKCSKYHNLGKANKDTKREYLPESVNNDFLHAIKSIFTLKLFDFKELPSIRVYYVDRYKFNSCKEFINSFSLDICCNYFDGQNIFCKNYQGIINNWAILTGICYLNEKSIELHGCQLYKVWKYILRGYKIYYQFNDKHYQITNPWLKISID